MTGKWGIFLLPIGLVLLGTATALGGDEVRDQLLAGIKVQFPPALPADKRAVKAIWIQEALRKQQPVHIRNAIIQGALDLRGLQIGTELALSGCEFRDAVDFSFSTFSGNLSLTDCTFHHQISFLEATARSLNISRAQFLLDRARMSPLEMASATAGVVAASPGDVAVGVAGATSRVGPAVPPPTVTMMGLTVTGPVGAGGAVFGDGVRVRLDSADFRKGAVFNDVHFGGDADFHRVHCGGELAMGGARFRRRVRFDAATIDGIAQFGAGRERARATFEGDATFVGTTFGEEAFFGGTRFEGVDGQTAFGGARFRGVADFSGAVFIGDVDFTHAHFGELATFRGATFAKEAVFNGATFEDKVLFSAWEGSNNAAFGGRADFTGAHFRRGADFQEVTFTDNADFNTAHFEHATTFGSARFNQAARFEGAQFTGLAVFDRAAPPEGERPDTTFQNVSFNGARFERDAHFAAASFAGPATFRGTVFRFLVLAKAGTAEPVGGSVDMRGCTFERFYGEWHPILSRLDPYDRQPYAELEKFLRTAGQDDDADTVYLERCDAERREEWRRGHYVAWAESLIYKLVANCGVRPYRIVIAFIALGAWSAFVFSRPKAVQPKAGSENADSGTRGLSFGDANRFTLRLLLPVDLPLARSWEPREDTHYAGLSFSDWATVFKIAGWVLVPLAVVGLTGWLKHGG
jgi:uncharacterized protein YjbI with pentapeptide repeats